jgi:Mg2+/Co2+ transporter CorC
MDEKLVEKGSRKKVHNREELKKLLRTARNRRILHMPKERMIEKRLQCPLQRRLNIEVYFTEIWTKLHSVGSR